MPATVNFTAEYGSPTMREEVSIYRTRWSADAASYRLAASERAELDLAYGARARQRLDLFKPASGESGPVAMFLHGGYWQAFDKTYFSHFSNGANSHGVTVAVVGYSLCPEVSVSTIIDEIRAAVVFLVKRFARPLTIYGHSAGGHLAACMLATDWQLVAPDLAADPVPAGLPISGLFDLEPLISTPLNARLRLSESEAHQVSPLFWAAPKHKSLLSYVGGNETSEYLRQTRTLVERWRAAGVAARAVEVDGASHFSVLSPLADPDSSLTRELVALARRAGATF